jgi:hypothetical protein
MRRLRLLATMLAVLCSASVVAVTQVPAEASTGGCTSSDWTGQGFTIGVCVNDRNTTTTAFPDIYVNGSPYTNTSPTSTCSILIEVWGDHGDNYSHDQVGCAKGHYNGYATPAFGAINLHAFARLLVNGGSYGTKDSPKIPLDANGRVLYDYDFIVAVSVSPVDLPISGHAADAFAELHRCFNCSFPIGNAPSAYPAENQYVALSACPFFSVCNAPVRFFSAQQNDYLMINSQPGHFDSAGSALRWRFWTDSSGYLHLEAKTWNLGSSIPDAANQAGAYIAWQQFALRLGYNLYNRCGGTHCS